MVEIEKLLKIVKKNRILYDIHHPEYKNFTKKEQLWNEIGVVLGEDGDMLKKKWKNLKDTYTKHLRAIKSKSEQSQVKKLRKWQWAKQMEGFKPFMVYSTSQSKVKHIDTNVKNICERISHIDSEDYIYQSPQHDIKYEVIDELNCESYQVTELTTPIVPPTPTPQTPPNISRVSAKTKRIEKQEDNDSQVSLVLQYLKEKRRERKMLTQPIDLIFSGYAQTVKTFTPQMQVIAKYKIAEVMSKLELQNQLNQQRNNCSTSEAQQLSSNVDFDSLNHNPVPAATQVLDTTALVDDDITMENLHLLNVEEMGANIGDEKYHVMLL